MGAPARRSADAIASTSRGDVVLRVDVEPWLKDALVDFAALEGLTLREVVEQAIADAIGVDRA